METSSIVAVNPFALMMDPQGVIDAVSRSERLNRLHSRICRPLDAPVRGLPMEPAPCEDDTAAVPACASAAVAAVVDAAADTVAATPVATLAIAAHDGAPTPEDLSPRVTERVDFDGLVTTV